MTDIVERCRAAGRDERLSTGALYLEAADEIEWLTTECLRLSHAEAEAMSVVLSLEGQVERLRAERDAAISEVGKYAGLFGSTEIERDRLRAELAAKTERVKWFESAGGVAMATRFFQVEAERDRLLELLREARPYLNGFGWGKPGVDLPDRIDAVLEKEKP